MNTKNAKMWLPYLLFVFENLLVAFELRLSLSGYSSALPCEFLKFDLYVQWELAVCLLL